MNKTITSIALAALLILAPVTAAAASNPSGYTDPEIIPPAATYVDDEAGVLNCVTATWSFAHVTYGAEPEYFDVDLGVWVFTDWVEIGREIETAAATGDSADADCPNWVIDETVETGWRDTALDVPAEEPEAEQTLDAAQVPAVELTTSHTARVGLAKPSAAGRYWPEG